AGGMQESLHSAARAADAATDPVFARQSPTYRRIKQSLDQTPAIDTHDHLFPFDRLKAYRETKDGKGVNLAGILQNSYLPGYCRLPPWQDRMEFDAWWRAARDSFDNVRAAGFYKYQLPAFQDLYGVDFDAITDEQARDLNRRIFENYKDQRWLYHVVTDRANIELMFNDPYWARLEFGQWYPWEVKVFNVTSLVKASHASEFTNPADSPYVFAQKHGLAM